MCKIKKAFDWTFACNAFQPGQASLEVPPASFGPKKD